MKNPLRHRIFREFKSDFGKSVSLILFVVCMVSVVSGFLVADDSLKKNYDASFAEFSIEDGHFTVANRLTEDEMRQLEKDVTLAELFYCEEEFENQAATQEAATVRIYANRSEVNRASLFEGDLPDAESEIALDRLFALKNDLVLGDTIRLGEREYSIVGLLALPDYSALFKENSEMMMDTKNFGVATVTPECFATFPVESVENNYAWSNKRPVSDMTQQKDQDEALKDDLIALPAVITDFLPRYQNQAIMFTGDDMGHDKSSILMLLYLIMVILAFIFATTLNAKLETEATVIGVLRSSGYNQPELLWHYLALPLLLLVVGAVIGNILGYTVMYPIFSDMYYNSYSLTKPVMSFNWDALLLTTGMPFVLVAVINYFVIRHKLNYPIMSFMRKDFSKRKQLKDVVKLPNWPFISRFRLRVIFQNLYTYLVLFVGIALVSTLLMFSLSMQPSLEHYQDEVLSHQFADYQYILKAPIETENSQAEKLSVTSLKINEKEKIPVYGVRNNSNYLEKLDLMPNTVAITTPYAKKFHLDIGDQLTLANEYQNKEYTVTVGSIYNFSQIALFMEQDYFNQLFDYPAEYYNAYLANQALDDLDKNLIATVITSDDYITIVRQLNDSMAGVMQMMLGLSVIIYLTFIYLLAKIVIEKNTYSISMLKIIGYSPKEIGKIYNTATAIVVLVSAIISVAIAYLVSQQLFVLAMSKANGWIEFTLGLQHFLIVFFACLISYFAVSFILQRKINQVALVSALKNIE